VQLVAESLGKTREIGLTPIKAVGATDQHSQLQLFSDGPADKFLFFVKLTNFEHEGQLPSEVPPGFDKLAGESIRKLIHAEGKATAKALAKKGVPSLTILLDKLEPASLAYLMYTFELMTALSGKLLGIDPFNQPGVELSKKYTYAILGKTGYEQYLPEMGE
jgi:glucose-6-phosphate isomerase